MLFKPNVQLERDNERYEIWISSLEYTTMGHQLVQHLME
jgi:hypothetical protein